MIQLILNTLHFFIVMEKERYIEQPDYNSDRVLEFRGIGSAIFELKEDGGSRLLGYVEKDIAYEYILNSKPFPIGRVKYK